MRQFTLLLVVAVGALVGCNKDAPQATAVAPTNAAAQPVAPAEPVKAQGKLKTIRLWLGPEELQTELALTPEQERTGMMFRTNMPENTAMLFVFPRPIQASFWMKNTVLPLSAAYIDAEGNIVEINDLKPLDTNAVVAASDDVQYVLEVNQGWFARHKIPTGTLVRTEYGSLPQTFFSRQPSR
jgi:uncharacterized membrane protein (UPF0127 family)